MELIEMFMIFIISIFAHEIGHILISWWFSKEIPIIRFRKVGIMVIPKSIYTIKQKKIFLGGPIIIGMLIITPFYFYYPTESFLAFIAYLISCGADFYNLMKLEVKNE